MGAKGKLIMHKKNLFTDCLYTMTYYNYPMLLMAPYSFKFMSIKAYANRFPVHEFEQP